MERLGFEDLMAPLPLEASGGISYDDARERVLRAFGGFHEELEASRVAPSRAAGSIGRRAAESGRAGSAPLRRWSASRGSS